MGLFPITILTNGNDTYHGNDNNNTVWALEGNDWVDGHAGNDILSGAAGNDTLWGDSGNDTLTGDAGRDTLYGGLDNDSLDGGEDSDYLDGGSGNDILRAGPSSWYTSDTIYGGAGNDTIYSSGRGYYNGDAGNDYIYAGDGLAETLIGGSGYDWLNTSLVSANYRVDLATGATNFTGEYFIEFESLSTGVGDDTLLGTSDANYLNSSDGNDYLDGMGGHDTLSGGAGNDLLRVRDDGYYFGSDGNDTMQVVTMGAAYISAGDGVDWLDTRVYNGNYSINLETGATNQGESAYNLENLLLGNGDNSVEGSSVDNRIMGASGDDYIHGRAGNDYLTGAGGNDTIHGGAGNDFIGGGDGDDQLFSWGGTDTINGFTGNDLIGSAGFGVFDGGAGNDTLRAGGGLTETLIGGAGIDLVEVTSAVGNYVLNLATGATQHATESFTGFENARMGSGNDRVTGTAVANLIEGGGGSDTLWGGSGPDTLRGDAGNDRLIGSLGQDVLTGGAGDDAFVFTVVADSPVGGFDTILDFQGAGDQPAGMAEDRIDLSGIDANALVAGNQAFVFNGTSAGGAGRMWLENVGTDTWLRANVDGTPGYEISIRLADGSVLAGYYDAGDFIL